jgi:predicted AAA+ superfamily ATPase
MDIYYWSSERSTGEVDFVIQYNEKIHPVEVKAEENLQAKSIKAFYQKYPNTKAIRSSMSDYREEDWLTNLPLYAIFTLAG